MASVYNTFDSASGLTLESSEIVSGELRTDLPSLVSRTTGSFTPGSASIETLYATLSKKPGGAQCWRQVSTDGTTWLNRYGQSVDNTGCYLFDAVNDQITVPIHADFQMGTGSFTLSLWVCGTAANQYGLIFGVVGANSHEWGIYQAAAATGTTTGKKIRVVLSQSGSVERRRLSTADLLYDAQWHHVAVVSNGSTLLLYFDGHLASTTDTNTGAWPNVAPTTNPVTIGGQSGKWWGGKIDDVRYYARALGAADVDILAQNHRDLYPADLRLYLKLDGNATDSSGYSHDGSIVGATSVTDFTMLPPFGDQLFGEIGTVGICPSLDGVNDSLYRAYHAAMHSASTLSCSGWIRTTSTSATGNCVASRYGSGSNRGWLMQVIPSTGKLLVFISADGGAVNVKNYSSSVTGLSDGLWHHVAFTWSSGTLKLYIDGVEDTSPTKTTDAAITTIYNPTTNANFVIGALASGLNWFSGHLANVALWNDVRTAGEIAAAYAAGFEDHTNANLIGYWPLGVEASMLTDLGPNGYTLTNSGSTEVELWTRPLPTTGLEKTLNISGLGLTTTAYWRILFRSTNTATTPAMDSVGIEYTPASGNRRRRLFLGAAA